eukprot:3229650-Pleurochrysis_carterae.AAC.1
MQLFSGTFASCTDGVSPTAEACASAYNDDGSRALWLNPPYGSFDDFGHSMLLLYVLSTGARALVSPALDTRSLFRACFARVSRVFRTRFARVSRVFRARFARVSRLSCTRQQTRRRASTH